MSFIKDTFFGGAEKNAARAQEANFEKAQDITREGTAQAREDLFNLFPAAQANADMGFQGALDVFGQSLPAQTNTFTQGNVGAQQALLQGLPQIQNALLGGQVDTSGFQPFQVESPDLGFFQQQLPQYQNPIEQTQQATLASQQYQQQQPTPQGQPSRFDILQGFNDRTGGSNSAVNNALAGLSSNNYKF